MSTNKENALTPITDIALAAALTCLGFRLLSLQKQPTEGRMAFIFESNEKLTETVASYWSDTVSVSPKKYYFALRELKSQIWASKEAS